jgi:hypothetical protein
LRTAMVFAPTWIASTSILLCLAAGVLPFYWFIAFILMLMPVVNASAATAMFFRKKKHARKELPNPWKSRIVADPEDDPGALDYMAQTQKTTLQPSNFQTIIDRTMMVATTPHSLANYDEDEEEAEERRKKQEEEEFDNREEDAWLVTSIRQLDGILPEKKADD